MITFNMFLLRILSRFCKILNRDENIVNFLQNSQYGCYGFGLVEEYAALFKNSATLMRTVQMEVL